VTTPSVCGWKNGPMSDRRFFDPSLPQTLQGAVLFSYLNGAIAVLSLLSGATLIELVIVLGGVGAYGIANERRWGYYLCLAAAIAFLLVQIAFFFVYPFVFASMINLLFSGFLVALLLHPASRSYQRIYFR